jgi:hypothetical protein
VKLLSRKPGAGGSLRQRLRRTRLVQKALHEPIELQLLQRPSARVAAGLVLIGASYVIGWPAIAALGALAAWTGQSRFLLGGPALYGLSWIVFAAGLALVGSKTLRSGRVFGLLLVRYLAERYLC